MFLSRQIGKLKKLPVWLKTVEKIKKKDFPIYLYGKNTGFLSFLVSGFQTEFSSRIILVVCPEPENAEILFANTKTFLKDSVFLFPEKDVHLPIDHPVQAKEIERVKCLAEILKKKSGVIISSINAVSLYLPDASDFVSHIIEIKPAMSIEREKIIARLIGYGYEEVSVVENPGEFCRRGGIIDFFPFEEKPYRIEFSGNKVASVRNFDPTTQMSTGKTDGCKILALNECFITSHLDSTIFDYLGENKIVMVFGANAFEIRYSQMHEICHRSIKKDLIGWETVKANISDAVYLETDFPSQAAVEKIHVFPVDTPNRFGFIGENFIWNKTEDEEIFIVEENKVHRENLKKILSQHNVYINDENFLDGYLSSSFSIPAINLTFLNAGTIFNMKQGKPPSRFMEALPVSHKDELEKGDYVVHFQHGIARFDGFERLGPENEEYMRLEFADNEKLYLPLSDIDFVHKYIGTKENPQLSKLGSKSWIRIRDNVKEGIRNIAEELYKLYVERKHNKGIAYPEDDEFQRMLEENFPYEETPDQLKAMKEIKRDLQSDRIMDRLLCGDSGYGKTELAIRAAFKVVCGGKQVAVLCPTTVLAQQHLRTFRDRMQKFPIGIEMLSRLYPNSKQKQILEKLARGEIDIIIGTHRILQDDVIFKDLGLIIIDEEQRFGVLHKEKLKTKFRNVEVLTLTATPIPRTLYLSLSGLRDISLLETPPSGRLSVATYIGKYSDTIVKMAIINELERQGQVFYLHNRIYDIQRVKNKLQSMFPATTIEIAHGRMDEREIARVMEEFADGKIQVLVATTIVENGLDVPNANTLIVDNAHLFGLADLYQLRGRVGRYKVKAYAYFLVPAHMPVSQQARERLKALNELVKPGSGMKIAMRDLQIRGAGDILGKKQSGYINQVGFQLYCRFWKEITSEYKGEKIPEQPRVKPSMRGFLDEDLIPAPGLRFEIYKRISEIQNKDDARKIIQEIRDRFGEIPEKLKNMIFELAGKKY
ncbi:MAG: transcription-repair coupling factor [Candidatus Omnitrophica bacterium]|nr:transcription-repair coupling factor [Candidatus Omnitrophota bacterium]